MRKKTLDCNIVHICLAISGDNIVLYIRYALNWRASNYHRVRSFIIIIIIIRNKRVMG